MYALRMIQETITIRRGQGGRIIVARGSRKILELTEDTAMVLAATLKGVAVCDPAAAIIHPETDRNGAEMCVISGTRDGR